MRVAVWTVGLLLAPAVAAAQDTTPPAGSTAPADAVGPRELQNFSLSGTVTRAADQPPAQSPAAAPPSRRTAAQQEPPRAASALAVAKKTQAAQTRPARAATAEPKEQAEPQVQQLTSAPAAAATLPAAAPSFPAPESTSGTLAPAHGLAVLPWLLAAFALAAGAAFLFWRNRSRLSFAGGPQVDLFSAEPEPAPAPAPPAPRPQPPAPRAAQPTSQPKPEGLGIVASTLRPWLEVAMQPLRCIVTDDAVTVEFELDLFNSGSAPARDVHVAAALVNAGETQEQALANFFGQRPGLGERIDVIQPLKRVTFTTQIVTSRQQVQVLEMGGRHVFVPVLAFNANYGWAAKTGQTCVSYLLGRDSQGEKLAPFRLDLGPRLFRKVGARPLPVGVRA